MTTTNRLLFAVALLFAAAARGVAASQAGCGGAAGGDTAKAVRVLYIGDSVTDGGWGCSAGRAVPSDRRNTTDLNHDLGHSYVYLCAAHFTSTEPEKGYRFFNRGISGNTLADLERRWKPDVTDMKPDVLSVLIGINDIKDYLDSGHGEPFDWQSWGRRYAALIDSARQHNPRLRVILGAPVVAHVGRFASDSAYAEVRLLVDSCRATVQRIAVGRHATFIPYCDVIDEAVRRHPSVSPAHWVWDGIHPTAAGHALMSRAWIEACGL